MHTASKSANVDNIKAYAEFTSLSEELRLAMLGSVYVLDSSSNIIDVRDEIARNCTRCWSRQSRFAGRATRRLVVCECDSRALWYRSHVNPSAGYRQAN